MSQVKNKESHYIENPFSISGWASVEQLKQLQAIQGIGTILVDNSNSNNSHEDSPTKRKLSMGVNPIRSKLIGIVTRRDIKFSEEKGE